MAGRGRDINMSNVAHLARIEVVGCDRFEVYCRMDGSVHHMVRIAPVHVPYPITLRDEGGTYDRVCCKRCGTLLIGSFV